MLDANTEAALDEATMNMLADKLASAEAELARYKKALVLAISTRERWSCPGWCDCKDADCTDCMMRCVLSEADKC